MLVIIIMKNLHLNENEYHTPLMETDDLFIKQNNIQADTDYYSNAKGISNATNNFIIPQLNTQSNKDNNDDVYHKASVYSNFFSEYVSIFERAYRISNLILIVSNAINRLESMHFTYISLLLLDKLYWNIVEYIHFHWINSNSICCHLPFEIQCTNKGETMQAYGLCKNLYINSG